MECGYGRSQRHETQAQNGFYQIAAQAECTTTFGIQIPTTEVSVGMNFFPINARERWLLLLFPFKAYVFLAPICFMVWELEASEQWVRGAREEAIGPVAMVYVMCLLVFVLAGVLGCFLRNVKLVVSSVLFAVCALLFPPMIYNHGGLIIMTISLFAFGIKFVSDRTALTPIVQQAEESFECPECGVIVPHRSQQCPRCAWTYLK